MGARVVLHLALIRPDLVERLVLVSGTAGIDDVHERAARRAADDALAAGIEADGVDAFLIRWLSQPLFAGLAEDAADVEARHTNTAEGLASSLRLAGTGTMDPPLWNRLGEIARAGFPVLAVVGERDAKFRALGRRLVDGIGPSARLAIIEGAGHACHLEAPEAFRAELTRFLDTPNP
jgi:2-succinyl-6-hydroxy-2,4-cyclohexadiene-1-carboxylate synthase